MKNKLAVLAALCAMLSLILASPQVLESSRSALKLCADLILPSLFPFFVLCGLLSRLGFPAWLGRLLAPAASRLFGVSGAGASALVVGLSGGYPMGAAYIAELHRSGQISTREAERLLAFCNNSGPAFLVGAVGAGVFGSVKTGLLLYAVHIAAALLTGLVLRGRGGAAESLLPAENVPPLSFSAALPEAVRQAVLSVLNVCGFVVCFTVFSGLLDSAGLFSAAAGRIASATGAGLHWVRALLTGFLELGSGVGALRGLSSAPANLALAAWLLGWGGVSVHFQTLSLLADSEIKSTLHLAGRFLSACFGAALAWLAGLLFL